MKGPTVSVVMPVYNGEKYLAEAMESVLNQTFTDFEFLAINDGSTDGTEAIIREYAWKDRRVRYIENEKNLGLVETLNRGLAMAEGKYIARMDADDICHEKRFEKQIDFLNSHEEISICGTFYQIIGNNKSIVKLPVYSDEINVGLIFRPELCHPSVVYRTAFLHEYQIKYVQESFPAEDYKMWVDCIKYAKLYNIPEPLLYYRIHDQQITREKHKIQLIKVNEIRLEMLNRLSPDFSEEQKEFHIKNFLSYGSIDIRNLSMHDKWASILIDTNKKTLNFSDHALRKELKSYLNSRVFDFFIRKIIQNKNKKSKNFIFLLKNISACHYLSPKQIMKLFIKFAKYAFS